MSADIYYKRQFRKDLEKQVQDQKDMPAVLAVIGFVAMTTIMVGAVVYLILF
jgi:mRNA-degrading endonuclease YafQ of YafQ-DinJ toxin-antitoxin module